MYKKVMSAAALLAMSISSAAFAATNGGVTTNSTNIATLQASANVDPSCAFSSNNSGTAAANNGFVFGDITTAAAIAATTVSASANLTYVCNTNGALGTGVTAIGLALSDVNGAHNTTTFDLKNTAATTANTIDFNIVQTGQTTEFVNSNVNFQPVAVSPVISLTATTSSTLLNLAAGAYSDTITATLNS